MSNFELISLAGIILAIALYYVYQKLWPNFGQRTKNIIKIGLVVMAATGIGFLITKDQKLVELLKDMIIAFLVWLTFFANLRGEDLTPVKITDVDIVNACPICGGSCHQKRLITFDDNKSYRAFKSDWRWKHATAGDDAYRVKNKKLFWTRITYRLK